MPYRTPKYQATVSELAGAAKTLLATAVLNTVISLSDDGGSLAHADVENTVILSGDENSRILVGVIHESTV